MTAFLVYAVFRAGEAFPETVLPGPDGVRVDRIEEGNLAAAVSLVSDVLARPKIEQLLAFAGVIEQLHGGFDLLPFRFGCLLRGEGEVGDLLRSRQEVFQSGLERVRGCVEMGLRLLPESNPEGVLDPQAGPSAEQAGPRTGVDYLKARQAVYAARDRVRGVISQHHPRVEQAFAGIARGIVVEEASVRPGGFHLLILRADLEAFRVCFQAFEASVRCPVLLTGPWPPYHFVPQPT